jgi:hypothetical protein
MGAGSDGGTQPDESSAVFVTQLSNDGHQGRQTNDIASHAHFAQLIECRTPTLVRYGRKCIKSGAIPKYRRCIASTSSLEPMECDDGIIQAVPLCPDTKQLIPTIATVKSPMNKGTQQATVTTPIRRIGYCNARIVHRLTPRSNDHEYMINKSPKTLLVRVKFLESRLTRTQALYIAPCV